MKNEFENLKTQGEIAAEKGELDLALEKLDLAMAEALKASDYKAAINIFGHRLHINKKHFQETGDADFMEKFYQDTQEGLKLAEEHNIAGQPKSVMQLRAGDYFLFKEEFEKAVEQYRLACEELNKSGQQAPETNGEYKSHYALALVKSGDTDEGLKQFGEALELTKNNHTLRPFHHDIIHSGTLLRQAEAYFSLGEKDKAKNILNQAKPIVENLAKEHKMPDRQKQWEKMQQNIK